MIDRCTNSKHPGYKDYGGRGIRVCCRWTRSFDAFLADMGLAPPGMTIDRIDNNGDYTRRNCRWTDPKTQVRNRRCVKLNEIKVRAIRAGVAAGASRAAMGRKFGVATSVVSRIVSGKVWA